MGGKDAKNPDAWVTERAHPGEQPKQEMHTELYRNGKHTFVFSATDPKSFSIFHAIIASSTNIVQETWVG